MNIILGITGSIAAYKAIELAKLLLEHSFDVRIVLSKTASDFVSVLILKSLFPGRVYEYDATLGNNDEMLHISLARFADLVLVAPTSANTLAKLAAGGADCLLTTVCLATQASIVLAPAMNKVMWENQLVQKNISTLKEIGFSILEPANGLQACGDIGVGRMMEVYEIVDYIVSRKRPKIFSGKKIVITAGATREKLDPVRFLSNYSSGKMGYAIARAASGMGADVTLISGYTSLSIPPRVKYVGVEMASEMLAATEAAMTDTNIFIGTAAVADYRPEIYSNEKIKKNQETMSLKLAKNVDIIKQVKQKYPGVFCVGFAAETNNIESHGRKKLKDKGLDLIAVNDVSESKVFNDDYNELHVFTKDGQSLHLARATKDNIAKALLEVIYSVSGIAKSTCI